MKILLFLTVFLIRFLVIQTLEDDLFDTRAATSDVGWVTAQGSEWQEASSSYVDGGERRVLMVCQMRKSKQDNWVRSPFIPVNGAQRVYVEFEFTMRSCEDVENVATCKETFNLFYYETDRDEATSTFPSWEENTYTKVDTIAADKRFHRGTSETNLETRDIGPISKNGIYVALQDAGACMALMHMRVYYKYCEPMVQNLAQFQRTLAGPERTSLVKAKGVCVSSARKSAELMLQDRDGVSSFCNSNGDWAVQKGQCLCDPGYTPNPELTSCKACGKGFFKPKVGNTACLHCPAYSHSLRHESTICDCMFGYFRATSDDPTLPCTKPPSKPENLKASVNRTTVSLSWDQPLHDGGRDDIFYRVGCEECQKEFHFCQPCPAGLDYLPSHNQLHVTNVIVHGLKALKNYKFKVFAENGVSDGAYLDQDEVNYAIVSIVTKQTEPQKITEVFVVNVAMTSFLVLWSTPEPYDNADYDVVVADCITREPIMRNKTRQTEIMVFNLQPGHSYSVEVRMSNGVDFGPFSNPLTVNTINVTATPPKEAQKNEPVDFVAVVVGAAAGVACVIVIVIAICYCRRRAKNSEKKGHIDFEQYPRFTGNSQISNGSYPHSQKIYIDPTVYDDPHKAVLDFTREIEVSSIKINSVIGGGEFGDVCLGSIALSGGEKHQRVAIKTLKTTEYNTPQKLDFLGEASIMGQFNHPNVIHLEGVVTKSRPLMIITEYMENGSLDGFLKKQTGQLTVFQLVGMLRNISEGMKYLSEMGYVHRDLAARNILVNSQLVCKVSDFGMSRVLEDDEDAAYTTRGGKIPIRWTAPEAITFRKFTSASDVWSYGIVMWEVMSYGERPYWEMSNRDVIQAVESGYRLPAPVECPLVQHHLMLECWKKNRNERPKFSDIVHALTNMTRDPTRLKIVAGVSASNSGRLVPTAEVMSLPVINEEHKSLSFNYATSTPVSKSSPDAFHPSSPDLDFLETWLRNSGLLGYRDNFLQCACYSKEQILRLKVNDLCRIGVTDETHQNILLDHIYSLKNNKDYNKKEAISVPEDNGEGISV